MKPATFDNPVLRSSDSARRARPVSGVDALDVYLDRVGRHPRLSAEQERVQLQALTELRRWRWVALLSSPAARIEILERVAESLDEPPVDLIRSTVGSDEESTRVCSEDAALIVALEALDTDGQLADELSAELPREGVEPAQFEAWERRVRLAGRRYLRARNRFVCANLRLVLMVTDRYSRRWMSLSDLVQEGNLGLIKAVERFDPERGTRFSTYAVWWIRHAITRALVNRGRTVRVPAHLHSLFMKIRRAKVALRGRLGRPATTTELAEHLDVPLEKLHAASEAMEMRSVSLEGSTDDDDDLGWSDRLGVHAPQRSIDDALDLHRHEAIALDALKRLPSRERDILRRRFALSGYSRMTLEALGRCHEVSRERIRQLQNRALVSLRKEVESSPISCLALA